MKEERVEEVLQNSRAKGIRMLTVASHEHQALKIYRDLCLGSSMRSSSCLQQYQGFD